MKFAMRTMAVVLTVVMLLSVLPLSAYAATLSITEQPKTAYAEYGTTAKTAVKATGDGLTYTWYIKNSGSTSYSKSSVTSSTYSAKMDEKSHDRYVYCVVKDNKGKSVRSNTVTLRVKATVTTEPKNTYVKQGATAKVTMAAKGYGLKYTWYIKNAGQTKYSKSSVTADTYSTKMSDKANGRYVYCVVTDKYGKTDRTKTIVMRQAATITTQPKNTTVANGELAKVSVKAVGDELTYTWYIKNAGQTKYSKSSVTKSTYSATMSDKVNGRYVYCVVTDKYGKTDKSTTVVLKQAANTLKITSQPTYDIARPGEQANFKVAVSGGTAPYTYQWQIRDYYFDWENINPGDWCSGSTTDQLDIIVAQDEYDLEIEYRCVITDATGAKVSSNAVWVQHPVYILHQPKNTYAQLGESFTFSVTPTAGKAPYTYKWELLAQFGSAWQECGTDSNTYSSTVSSTLMTDYYYGYRCTVTDANGDSVVSNVAYLNRNLMKITSQPTNVFGTPGDQATFTVTVSGGTAPLTYQWQMCDYYQGWTNLTNGSWFTGVNTNRLDLIVDRDEFVNENKYRCVITDANGQQVITNAAWVVEGVYIAAQPQNVTARKGDRVSFSVTAAGGTSLYSYEWQYRRVAGDWETATWADGYKTNTMSFQVTSEQEWEEGYEYRCVVTDTNGSKAYSMPAHVVQGY